MLCPSLVVLDVGHGSAAVLFDKSGVVAVDAGKGGVLLDFLRAEGIKQ
jgi:beta-lactamase superfamily II metal-dependent hydrolase